MRAELRWLAGALLVAVPWALLVHRFWFVCDDAYITFRYARNLARGLGLTFDPGDPDPVEGFSDLGWMGLAAVCERLGWRSDAIMPWVACAAAGATLILTVRIARARLGVGAAAAIGAGVALGLTPAFAVWSSGGLETSAVALCVLALVDAWALGRAETRQDELLGAVAATALVAVRVDGALWVAGIAAAAAIGAARDGGWASFGRGIARIARSAAPAIGAAVAIELWRRLTFGVWVPHTAAVKAAVDAATLARGARYVGAWIADGPLPACAVACAVSGCVGARIGRGRALALVLAGCVAPCLAIAASGDFLPFWRLLVPAAPVCALAIAAGLDAASRRGVVVAIVLAGLAAIAGLGSAFGVDPVADALRPALGFRVLEPGLTDPSELARWDQTRRNAREFAARGRALAQIARPGDAVVSVGVGAVGYFGDTLVVLDRCGLVDREVGSRAVPPGPLRSPGHDKLVPAEFFAGRAPRFLHARVVDGLSAPDEMRALLDQWAVRADVRDRYLPDWYDGGRLRFLLVVRRAEPAEDPRSAWAGFGGRLDRLTARIRAGR